MIPGARGDGKTERLIWRVHHIAFFVLIYIFTLPLKCGYVFLFSGWGEAVVFFRPVVPLTH
jgi:hypothetical protein